MKTLILFFIISFTSTCFAQSEIVFNESWFGDNISYRDSKNEKQKVGVKQYIVSNTPKHTVLHLHGCGGVKDYSMSWVNRLNEWGYNVVIVDSFSMFGSVCYDNEKLAARPYNRVEDMYAVAAWVGKQPWNKGKPAAIGFSHGATTLHLASQSSHSKKTKQVLSSAIAFYPFCYYDVLTDWAAEFPFQMHVGKLDNWTPAWLCDGHANFQSDTFDYRSYEGAHHGWDMGFNATMNAIGVSNQTRPRTIEYNAEVDRVSAENTKQWLKKFFN